MYICSICMNNIYFFYYKCNCNCKAVYHLDCIKSWFIYKNMCPICKNKENRNNINIRIRNINRFYETLIIIGTLLIITIGYFYSIFYNTNSLVY